MMHDHHRRSLQSTGGALTLANTGPPRLKLNFDSLYEDKAPQYSACFGVGPAHWTCFHVHVAMSHTHTWP